MLITGPESRLYVVVGVIRDRSDRLLVQQRLADKPCAGQWEFPGGKLEQDEDPGSALARELYEELGIFGICAEPLVQVAHDYDHARVWLDVSVVTEYRGFATNLEGQHTAWKSVDEIRQMNVLPAVYPILGAYQSWRFSGS